MRKLYKDLLKSYDKRVTPRGQPNDTLLVVFDAITRSGYERTDIRQSLLLESTLADGQLTWNPADYGGIQSLALPGDTIWEPEIRLANDVDFAVSKNNRMTTMLKVMSSGLVMYYYVDRMKCSCSIGPRYFSFDDQQNRTFSFTQLQYMIWDMDIINTKDLALDHFMESNSYEIVNTKSHIEV